MRNSYVKLASAALVILAVVLGLTEFLGPGGKSGVAWAQIMEKAAQAPTVVFTATSEYSYPQDRKLVLQSKSYLSAEYGGKYEMYYEGKLLGVDYILPRQKVVYRLRVDRKQYQRIDLSDEEVAQRSRRDDPRAWLKNILSCEYTKLGRTTINGKTAEGVECQLPKIVGAGTTMRVWVDVETNLPMRIEIERLAMLEGQMRPHKGVMENFEWDLPLDASLFEPNIPADYVLIEDSQAGQAQQENPTAQSTPAQTLTEQERAARPKIKETVRLYLQACSDRNWDEILKHVPGFAKLTPEQRASFDAQCGGLEVTEIGEPFKTEASDIWRVPCQIKWKGQGEADADEVRVRYDQTLRRFVICGGP